MSIVNTQTVTLPNIHLNTVTKFTAVLTQDARGLYAVYMGTGSDEWVAAKGHKATYEQAVIYFPTLPEERYRS